ncbi:MAG: hypothetical protein HKN67_05465 [Saprospiraceae bacterium]|nr:hypothetical protein [Saprospiraceae bacterium]
MRKEISNDLRGKFGFTASLLYLVTIVFVVYKMIGEMNPAVKSAFFWVIILFTAINFVSQSFSTHMKKRKIYLYQLYDPTELIISRLILNFLKLMIAGLVLVLIQAAFTNSMVKDPLLFLTGFLLASVGIISILSLVASISIYSKEQTGLMTILALPLLIPVLLLAMRISLVSERMFVDSSVSNYLMMLTGIDLLLVTLVIVFFPIVWKS